MRTPSPLPSLQKACGLFNPGSPDVIGKECLESFASGEEPLFEDLDLSDFLLDDAVFTDPEVSPGTLKHDDHNIELSADFSSSFLLEPVDTFLSAEGMVGSYSGQTENEAESGFLSQLIDDIIPSSQGAELAPLHLDEAVILTDGCTSSLADSSLLNLSQAAAAPLAASQEMPGLGAAVLTAGTTTACSGSETDLQFDMTEFLTFHEGEVSARADGGMLEEMVADLVANLDSGAFNELTTAETALQLLPPTPSAQVSPLGDHSYAKLPEEVPDGDAVLTESGPATVASQQVALDTEYAQETSAAGKVKDRRTVRREKNNVASKVCRASKKSKVKAMEEQVTTLEASNESLRLSNARLEDINKQLKEAIATAFKHAKNGTLPL